MDKEQRIAHLSKGFTKAELINLVIDREDELEHALQERNKYAEETSALKSKMQEALHKYAEEAEEQNYARWKDYNGKYLRRFIKEFLKESLTISMDSTYGGYVTATLKMNGTEISSDDTSVTIGPNPLDE
jgi:chorismate mutase